MNNILMPAEAADQFGCGIFKEREFIIVGREDTSIVPPTHRMTLYEAQEQLNKRYDRAIADHFSDVNVDMAEGMIEDNCSKCIHSCSVVWPDGQLDLQIYFVSPGYEYDDTFTMFKLGEMKSWFQQEIAIAKRVGPIGAAVLLTLDKGMELLDKQTLKLVKEMEETHV